LILSCLLHFQDHAFSQDFHFDDPVKLPSSINSKMEESLPLFVPFENKLYFVRTNTVSGKGEIDQNIFFSTLQPDSNWAASKPAKLWNNSENNALVGFSRGNYYLLDAYHKYRKRHFGVVKWSDSTGSIPVALDLPDLYTQGPFSGIYLHPSGGILLVSMEIPGGKGKEDIYVCLRNRNGEWEPPVPLGGRINTEGYEISPFLTADGSTLFFSRETPENDADIYYTTRNTNTWNEWKEPVKLNLNSNGFDAYFSLTPDMSTGFFVSDRGHGLSDIYQIKRKVSAEIAEKETAKDKTVSDFLIEQTQVDDKDTLGSIAPEFSTRGNAIIYFELGSAELQPEMKKLLDFLAKDLLQENSYYIELNGFADDLGSAEYNLKLSENRAKSVMHYLEQKGLSAEKITFFGKGEITDNINSVNEIIRAQNRRVEIILFR
jgi:outer membrane protein OmpA-like peptidoglycan-associated protein